MYGGGGRGSEGGAPAQINREMEEHQVDTLDIRDCRRTEAGRIKLATETHENSDKQSPTVVLKNCMREVLPS